MVLFWNRFRRTVYNPRPFRSQEPIPLDGKLPVGPTHVDPDAVTFRWFRLLNQLKIPLRPDPPRVTIRAGVLRGLHYSELRVEPVDLQDAGTYRCFIERANPRLEPDQSPLFNVSVYGELVGNFSVLFRSACPLRFLTFVWV